MRIPPLSLKDFLITVSLLLILKRCWQPCIMCFSVLLHVKVSEVASCKDLFIRDCRFLTLLSICSKERDNTSHSWVTSSAGEREPVKRPSSCTLVHIECLSLLPIEHNLGFISEVMAALSMESIIYDNLMWSMSFFLWDDNAWLAGWLAVGCWLVLAGWQGAADWQWLAGWQGLLTGCGWLADWVTVAGWLIVADSG